MCNLSKHFPISVTGTVTPILRARTSEPVIPILAKSHRVPSLCLGWGWWRTVLDLQKPTMWPRKPNLHPKQPGPGQAQIRGRILDRPPELVALEPSLPLFCQGQLLFYRRSRQEAYYIHLMGVKTKGKNPSSHRPPCPLSLLSQLGIHSGGGGGRSLHTQARENCASDVRPLVSFNKESPAGIVPQGHRTHGAPDDVRVSAAAADPPSSLVAGAALAATHQESTWELLPTPHSLSSLLPLFHPRAPLQLQGRACKRGGKWAGIRERAPRGPSPLPLAS